MTTKDQEQPQLSVYEDELKQMEAVTAAVKQRRAPSKFVHRHRAQSIIQSEALDQLETEVVTTGLYENVNVKFGSAAGIVAAEVFYSYIWWSVLSAFPGVVWFYPLCAMEISGFEGFAISWLVCLFFRWRTVFDACSSPLGLLLLRLISIVGVASLQAAPSTLTRLLLHTIGYSVLLLELAAVWWNRSTLDCHRQIYCRVCGYLLLLATRVWTGSFNPIYFYFTLNACAVALCLFVVLFLFAVDRRTPIIIADLPPHPPPPHSPSKPSPSSSSSSSSSPPPKGGWIVGVALGSLIHLTLFLFGDVSVLSRWAVAPYPTPEPNPYPWGMVTMLCLTLGAAVISTYDILVGSLGWTLLGLTSAMVLYYSETFVAFAAGCLLAIYVMSVWPNLARRATAYPPAKVLAGATFGFLFFILFAVWTVAYNFVPGGVLTRERTDVLLLLNVLAISAGVQNYWLFPSARKRRDGTKRRKNSSGSSDSSSPPPPPPPSTWELLRRRLSTIVEEEEEEEEEAGEEGVEEGSVHKERARQLMHAEEKEKRKFTSKVKKVAVVILLLALLGFAYRYQPPISPPEKERPDVFSAGIWAFHFGYDNDGFPSMGRASQFIADTGVDVIGLLETDAAKPYVDSHDIASWLSEELGMYVDYGPGPKDHTWGALLLSKYPILESRHYLLPSPDGEVAPAVLATVNISGNMIDFYVVHFGNDVDDLDRKLQGQKSAELLRNTTRPAVVLGYITSKPGTRDYRTIVESGGMKDIDPTDKKRFCEYVFYKGLVRMGYARVSHGGLSDTEIQIGKFRFPSGPDDLDAEMVTYDPKKVPELFHFPEIFGSLRRGHNYDETRHRFHMNTPKYFLQTKP